MKFVPRLVAIIVVVFLTELVGGKILHPSEVYMHPSGHATYVKERLCSIDAEVPPDDFHTYLLWCEEIQRKEHPKE